MFSSRCARCDKRFQSNAVIPQLLTCGYNNCQRCISEISVSNEILECVCGKKHSSVDLCASPKNLILLQILEGKIVQYCEVCEEKHEATSKCLDCGEYCCSLAASNHTFTKFTKGHRVVLLNDPRLRDIFDRSFDQACPLHKKRLDQYDTKNKKLCCSDCILFKASKIRSSSSLNQDVLPLSSQASSLRNSLQLAITQLFDRLQLSEKEILKTQQDLEESKTLESRRLDSEFKKLFEELETRYKRAKEELNQFHEFTLIELREQSESLKKYRELMNENAHKLSGLDDFSVVYLSSPDPLPGPVSLINSTHSNSLKETSSSVSNSFSSSSNLTLSPPFKRNTPPNSSSSYPPEPNPPPTPTSDSSQSQSQSPDIQDLLSLCSIIQSLSDQSLHPLKGLSYGFSLVRGVAFSPQALASLGSTHYLPSRVGPDLFPFQSFNFTNALTSGPSGPSLHQLLSFYSSTLPITTSKSQSSSSASLSTSTSPYPNLPSWMLSSLTNPNNPLYSSEDGFQYFIVPATGFYTLIVCGARGAHSLTQRGAAGATLILPAVQLCRGDRLKILVGQSGLPTSDGCGGGGGGASYVYNLTTRMLLAVAGGGGGAGRDNSGQPPLNSHRGGSGLCQEHQLLNNGGDSGLGGTLRHAGGHAMGWGGAGWAGDGPETSQYGRVGGSAAKRLSGEATGGAGQGGSWFGGFGGGGGGANRAGYGGGGGGFSGGGGGGSNSASNAGGGGSGGSYAVVDYIFGHSDSFYEEGREDGREFTDTGGGALVSIIRQSTVQPPGPTVLSKALNISPEHLQHYYQPNMTSLSSLPLPPYSLLTSKIQTYCTPITTNIHHPHPSSPIPPSVSTPHSRTIVTNPISTLPSPSSSSSSSIRSVLSTTRTSHSPSKSTSHPSNPSNPSNPSSEPVLRPFNNLRQPLGGSGIGIGSGSGIGLGRTKDIGTGGKVGGGGGGGGGGRMLKKGSLKTDMEDSVDGREGGGVGAGSVYLPLSPSSSALPLRTPLTISSSSSSSSSVPLPSFWRTKEGGEERFNPTHYLPSPDPFSSSSTSSSPSSSPSSDTHE